MLLVVSQLNVTTSADDESPQNLALKGRVQNFFRFENRQRCDILSCKCHTQLFFAEHLFVWNGVPPSLRKSFEVTANGRRGPFPGLAERPSKGNEPGRERHGPLVPGQDKAVLAWSLAPV